MPCSSRVKLGKARSTLMKHQCRRKNGPLRFGTGGKSVRGARRPMHVPAYGMGGLGRGVTPQIADVQDGSGGVGIMVSLPWVDALPPVMH
jgi:hypothetical protein